MKILVVSNLYPPHALGGYEERCRQIVEALKAKGHSVCVLTSDFVLEGVSDEDHSVIRELEINGFFGRPWLPIHKLYKLERRNHERLMKAVKDFKPDLVHVWNMGGISKSLLLRMEEMEIPVVYDVSDHWIARSLAGDVWLSWWNDPGSILRHASRGLLKLLGMRKRIDKSVPTRSYRCLAFERIYFCSEFLRQLTVDRGYPVKHGSVIYCGVESDKFPVKQEFNPPRRLLWVGRFAEDKDPLTAIEAMVLLKDGPLEDCQLDLYGRGDPAYTTRLKNRVIESGLSDKVNFCFAPHKELRNRFCEYDALLFTSNWGEPFALTPLEAMAAGLPVLLSPDGGDRELGHDGENCLIIEAANPHSIVRALHRLSQFSDYGKAMAETAGNELMERYDMKVIVDQIESYLMESMRNKK